MPYKAKGKCVYKKDTGKKVGCTKGSVKKYLAALHANVPDAKTEEIQKLKKPMKIKLSEIAKQIVNEGNYSWGKSGELAADRAAEKGDGEPSQKGYSGGGRMVGITFFDVPPGKEGEARRVGLTQFKSGKWGYKHQFDKNIISVASDREKSNVSAAEQSFGKGRYWEPRTNEGEQPKHDEPSKRTSDQSEDRFEWENDPYHDARFQKSGMSWREYDRKMNPKNYNMEEGEKEKLGGSAHDREEKAAGGKKAICKVCHKPFTPSYGEHSRCPSCMSKKHSSGEKATGTQ